MTFFHHAAFRAVYIRHRGGSPHGQLPCQNSFPEKGVGGFAFPKPLPFSSKTDCGSSSCFPDSQVENPVPGWPCPGDSVLLLHQAQQFWNLNRDVLFYPKVPFSLSMSVPTKAELRTLITELVLFSLI